MFHSHAKLPRWIAFVLLASAIFLLSACATKQRIDPVKTTFLEDTDTTSKSDRLPFIHAWVKPDFQAEKWTKLYIKPVRIDLLPEDAWKASKSSAVLSKEDYIEMANKLAEYFRTKLIDTIIEKKSERPVIVDKPGADVVTLEIAFTELEFSHPIIRATSMLSPIPATGVALSSITDPHVAFAARFYDGSGNLFATIADRLFPPVRILDFNKVTASSSAREACTTWSEMLAETFTQDKLTPVRGKTWFSLTLW